MTLQESPKADWTARWCWPQESVARPWNYYAFFRKVIDLPAKPPAAIVRVSADARYTLYVNGKRVHFGPARSYPEHQSYDQLDIAGFLQPGRNTLCAIVHQFGIPTSQSVYRDAAGFLLDGVIELPERRIELHTPHGWLCRKAAGWRKDVARLSARLGFQEHFDAGEDLKDWMLPEYDASQADGWITPCDIGPVGCHPWLTMEPRHVPLLASHVESFRSIAAMAVGENARGYKIAEDVYRLALGEKRKREKSVVENPQAMLRDDDELTIITPPPEGQSVMVVLDLGQIRAGHIMLDLAEAAGDEIIDILYTEEADKNGLPLLLGETIAGNREEAVADRYRCRPGPQRWEPFFFKGLRYASLIFRNLTRPLKIRHVALRQVHSDLQDIGSFECSDAALNRIWLVGRETQRNCMYDAYVDCPWREQAQWWMDARVQFRVNAYAFGDVTLLERGIRQLAQSQAADGSLHAHPPSDAPNHRLPDCMLTWIGTLWDHYFHTGDKRLIAEMAPTMHRLLDFFARHEIRDGLIGGFDGFSIQLDWQDLHKADFSGVLNMMYLQALRWASAICFLLDDEASSERYSAKATRLAVSIEKHFWDAKSKAWRDGFDPVANAPVEALSQHMAALAILLDLKPEAHAALAKDLLLKSATSRRTKVLTASPFFYAYVLEALAEAGYHEEVVCLIRDKWGAMIDQGATTFWETWEPAAATSRCHARSASALYHLSQQVLGVTPVDVGWKQVRIAPAIGKLEFARGRVPTPLGIVAVEWERAGEDQLAVHVELPARMQAEFVSPVGEIRTLGPGTHQFHT